VLSPAHRYLDLNWHQLQQNIDGIREFFWAVRPLEYIVFAGAIAIARRSVPKAILIFGWFMTFLILKGTDSEANVADASIFRLLMPSFPAFVVLLAAIPLLLPAFRFTRRVFTPPPPVRWRAGYRTLGAVGAVLVLIPLVLVAGAPAQSTPRAINYPVQDVYVPVTRAFDLSVRQQGDRQVLTWKAPYSGRVKVFYTVLRSKPTGVDPTSNGDRKTSEGISCRPRLAGSSLLCLLFMDRIAPTRTLRYVDRPKRGRWTYRVAMSANWEDNPDGGDMLLVSEPVTIKAP
jgi:hypothetical protein